MGLQGAVYGGEQIEVIAAPGRTFARPIAWATQVRLGLLRFVTDHFTASALVVDWGYGADAGSLATAIGVTFIDIGIRL